MTLINHHAVLQGKTLESTKTVRTPGSVQNAISENVAKCMGLESWRNGVVVTAWLAYSPSDQVHGPRERGRSAFNKLRSLRSANWQHDQVVTSGMAAELTHWSRTKLPFYLATSFQIR